VGYRATQLVAAGVLGMIIGGGIVGAAVGLSDDGHPEDRPGYSRHYDGR
jgi:hypothetical protein